MAAVRMFCSTTVGASPSERQAPVPRMVTTGPCNPQSRLDQGAHPTFAASSVVLGAAAAANLATQSSKRRHAGAARTSAIPDRTAQVMRHAAGDTQLSPGTSTSAVGEVEQPNSTSAGFDPLGDTDTDSAQQIKPVELVLGRIAMLAAVGYPAAELYHDDIAQALHMPNRLAPNGQAPTLLNNGIFSPIAEIACVLGIWGLVAAAVQSTYARANDDEKLDAMNPQALRLPYLSPMLKSILNEVQRFNGRVAMLAVVIMIGQEAITGQPAVGALAAP